MSVPAGFRTSARTCDTDAAGRLVRPVTESCRSRIVPVVITASKQPHILSGGCHVTNRHISSCGEYCSRPRRMLMISPRRRLTIEVAASPSQESEWRTLVQSPSSSFSKQADGRGNSTIISTLITVCKGRQKRHELIFLLGCQSEAADRRIYVLSYLRGRPTRRLLSGIPV
jgi:hypothetical protein